MSSPDIQPKNEEETDADGAVADNPSPYEEHVSVEDDNNLQCDAVSSSTITGEFTTITNVLDGHNINDGVGEPYCSPALSKFEVVDIIDDDSIPRTASAQRSKDGSNLESFDSYYHMQKNGSQIIPETDKKLSAHSIMRYGWRGGGMSGLTGSSLAETNNVKEEAIEIERFCEDASETNTNDRASSLSSLTNDFIPKMSRKGGFFTHKRYHRETSREIQGSNTPTSSSSQSLKIFPKSVSTPRSKRNNIVHESPWYLNKHRRGAPSPQNSSDQTPITTNPPGEVLVTPSQEVSDSGPTPSVISSSSISQYFTNQLREMYNSDVYSYYRHRYDQALSSPRAKRVIISSIILAALFAIIAIIAITLDVRSQDRGAVDESGAVSYYDMQGNGGLPEKCCIDKLVDNEKLLETDTQDRIESSTTNDKDDNDDGKEEVTSPAPSSVPQNILPDWDYVVVLTPNPTVGAAKVPGSATTQLSPSPTPGQDSVGWKPSIVPSLQISLQIPVTPVPTGAPTRDTPAPTVLIITESPTLKPSLDRPSRRPTRKPTKRPTTKKPSPVPTEAPTLSTPVPTGAPTRDTPAPTVLIITESPTLKPSLDPVTGSPTIDTSTDSPTLKPIISTASPTSKPSPPLSTITPTPEPTSISTNSPTKSPTLKPIITTASPTSKPSPPLSTITPTPEPTSISTNAPTKTPSTTLPTFEPSPKPTTSTPTPLSTITPTPEPTSTSTNSPTKTPFTTLPTFEPSPKPTTSTLKPTELPVSANPTTREPIDTLSPTRSSPPPSKAPTPPPVSTDAPVASPETEEPTQSTPPPTIKPSSKPTLSTPPPTVEY